MPLIEFIARAKTLITHGPDPNDVSAWEEGLLQLDELASQVRARVQSIDARLLYQATHGLAVESHFSRMDWATELYGPLALATRIARLTVT